MLVTKKAKTVTNILKLSPTHFVSNIRHQHRCNRSPTFTIFLYNVTIVGCCTKIGILSSTSKNCHHLFKSPISRCHQHHCYQTSFSSSLGCPSQAFAVRRCPRCPRPRTSQKSFVPSCGALIHVHTHRIIEIGTRKTNV